MRFLGLVLLVTLMFGCGGGGTSDAGAGSGGGTSAAPQVLVRWPERSRNVTGSSAALSVAVILQTGAAGTPSASFAVNRRPEPAGYTAFAVGRIPVSTGTYRVDVSFHAQPDGKGPKLATATFVGKMEGDGRFLSADGTPLPPIATVGEVETVKISNPFFPRLTPTQIEVEATTKSGDRVALSPGSARFELRDTFRGTLTPDGVITIPNDDSVARMNIVLDGKSYYAEAYGENRNEVVATAYIRSQTAVALALTGKLYATTGTNAGSRSLAFHEIDPGTGAVSRSIPLGFEGRHIYIAEAAPIAYVLPLDRRSVTKIDLNTMTVVESFDTNAGTTVPRWPATTFLVCPFDADRVAMLLSDSRNAHLVVRSTGGEAKTLSAKTDSLIAWIDRDRVHQSVHTELQTGNAFVADYRDSPMKFEDMGPVPFRSTVNAITFSRGGKLIQNFVGTLEVYDLAGLKLLFRKALPGSIYDNQPSIRPNELEATSWNASYIISLTDGRTLRAAATPLYSQGGPATDTLYYSFSESGIQFRNLYRVTP